VKGSHYNSISRNSSTKMHCSSNPQLLQIHSFKRSEGIYERTPEFYTSCAKKAKNTQKQRKIETFQEFVNVK
jgi:hypothetical protein